jgi:hypothetical protein
MYSGVYEKLLQQNIDVYLLLPDHQQEMLKDFNGAQFQPLHIPRLTHKARGLSFLREVIGCAFSRRNKIGSYVIYRSWYSRHFTAFQRLRRKFVEFLGGFAQPAFIFFGLYRLYNFLYKWERDLTPIRQQLSEIKPDLILSTFNVDSIYERSYVLAAKEMGIPLGNSIMGFDNLTSKAAHLVYDFYLVWNEKMKDQLLRFYPQVESHRVYITGTPQFDFHRRPDCLWKREDTLNDLGLPPQTRYFLYAASPKSLTPGEPELIARLAERMQNDRFLKDFWLVIRVHPRDDWSRWEIVRRSYGRSVLSKGRGTTAESNGSRFPTLEDQARLTSSLAHCEACINIASTMTFDGAIQDRPVIGIRFDQEPDAPREILYEEYDTDHYRPLVQSGGLRLAGNWDELLDLMRQAIQHPERDHLARVQMVAQECGVVDGKAGSRVADTLLTCLEKIHG